MGKHTLLTPEAQETICRLTREGKFLSAAATKAGVHRDTVYGWLERGEADPPAEGDEIYVEFARAFRDAEADMEIWAIEQICEKTKGWQAIAWLLERRWPLRYSARALIQHEHSGPGGGPIRVSTDDLFARIQSLAAEAPALPAASSTAASAVAPVPSGSGDTSR